jgi:dephospho-CoA kinase
MIVGLTGGSGSGKSVVARILEMLGCRIFVSDEQAHRIYADAQIKANIIALLGAEAYSTPHEINRAFIRERIFSDPVTRQAVNKIIHPAVGKIFSNFVAQNKNSIIVKESALLYETGLNKQADVMVVVAADDELRIKRIKARDHLSHDEALSRLQSQMSQAEKIKRADYVIFNNEKELLIPQVLKLHEKLLNK